MREIVASSEQNTVFIGALREWLGLDPMPGAQINRSEGRSKRKAECHADRPHFAKGFCGTCYVAAAKKRRKGLS